MRLYISFMQIMRKKRRVLLERRMGADPNGTYFSLELIASDHSPHPNPPLRKGRELVSFSPPFARGGNWLALAPPFARGGNWLALAPPFRKVRKLVSFSSSPCEGGGWEGVDCSTQS